MKLAEEEINLDSELQVNHSEINRSSDNEVSEHHIPFEIYDEDLLKIQYMEKYSKFLESQRPGDDLKSRSLAFILSLIEWLCFFLQQLWIQLFPQWLRAKKFGEKDERVMMRHQNLYCGSPHYFFQNAKKHKKTIFLLLQQSPESESHSLGGRNFFDFSIESNLQLECVDLEVTQILQYETLAMNTQQLREFNEMRIMKVDHKQLSSEMFKYPLLLVLRGNFIGEICSAGYVELGDFSKDHFDAMISEIKYRILTVSRIERESIQALRSQSD